MGGVRAGQGAGGDGGVGWAVGLGSLLVGDDLGVEAGLVGGVTDGPLAAVGEGHGVAARNAAIAVTGLLVGVGALLGGRFELEGVWDWLAERVVRGSDGTGEGLGGGVEVASGVEPHWDPLFFKISKFIQFPWSSPFTHI